MNEWIQELLTDSKYLGKFTITENILLLIGVLFWVYVYAELIYRSFKDKFVEMPVFIACGNIIWEFLWGFVIYEEMGLILEWGYRLAFVLDAFIFYNVIRYGQKQFSISMSREMYYLLLASITSGWGLLIYTFQINQYDLFTGSNSAYILNLFISCLYPVLYLKMGNQKLFSFGIAWTKWIGTAFFTAFLFLYFPNQPFVLALGVLVFLADLLYFVIIWKDRDTLAINE
jgi:hypothetical protein